MIVGDLQWKQREREWLIEDIEYFTEMVERWEELGIVELAEHDKKYLKEKRDSLRLLREGGKGYENQFKKEVLGRVPIRAENTRGAETTI